VRLPPGLPNQFPPGVCRRGPPGRKLHRRRERQGGVRTDRATFP